MYIFVLRRFTSGDHVYAVGTQPVVVDQEDRVTRWTNEGKCRAATSDEITAYQDAHPAVLSPDVPEAGTTGQILAKVSDVDFDTEWIDAPTAGVGMLLLASTAVDLNEGTAAKQVLYTVPAGRRAIPARVDLDKLSGAPTAAVISLGWNAPGTNVLEATTLSDLITSAASYGSLLASPVSAPVGAAAQTLGLVVTTPEGSALTGIAHVFGYLTDTNGVPVSS